MCVRAIFLGLLATIFTVPSGMTQERFQPSKLPVVSPSPSKPGAVSRPERDLAKLSFAQKQAYLSAQRGLDWLQRHLRADGRFGYVSDPALRKRNDNDHFVRQATAAFAMARAARFFQDERAAALATQAVLTLLIETAPDNLVKPSVRHTTVPDSSIPRLASAGLLLLAIHELPAPASDLLDQSEQLCNYLRRQQRSDGALTGADQPSDPKAKGDVGPDDPFAGIALYGIVRSQQHRPAAAKTEVLKKALAYYHAAWRTKKNALLAPGLTSAFAEAYLVTKEQAFADAVFDMGDWLCTLQYPLDPHRPQWVGGFMSWTDGKANTTLPDISSARYVETLAQACRVARQAGDATRHSRYLKALEQSLPFVASLQYTQANTQHFAEWYRDEVLGAFHVSHQDATLRLDAIGQAVAGQALYLTQVAPLP